MICPALVNIVQPLVTVRCGPHFRLIAKTQSWGYHVSDSLQFIILSKLEQTIQSCRETKAERIGLCNSKSTERIGIFRYNFLLFLVIIFRSVREEPVHSVRYSGRTLNVFEQSKCWGSYGNIVAQSVFHLLKEVSTTYIG